MGGQCQQIDRCGDRRLDVRRCGFLRHRLPSVRAGKQLDRRYLCGPGNGRQRTAQRSPGCKSQRLLWRTGAYKFGTTAKINAAAFTQAPNYTFGDAPKTLGNVRNFTHKEEDLQASKRIPLFTERVNFLFRFDAFNIFNRHSFGCMDYHVGDPAFGQFQCGTGPNAETNNNQSGIVSSARTLQANFRITF